MQDNHIGTAMLVARLQRYEQPVTLVTYTRNPAVLKMLGRVCGAANVYPLTDEPSLRTSARAQQYANVAEDGVAYHLGRYAYDGGSLYGSEDPASLPMGDGRALQDQFTELQDPTNALVVVARYNQTGAAE